jgi:hypothetical protein
MPIDHFSVSALYVETFFDDTMLSTATGFTYLKDGRHYLVTNWHVVSGRNPDNGQPLSDHGGIPNRIEFYIHTEDSLAKWTGVQKSIIDANSGQPLWLEHPTRGQIIDVVVMPVNEMPGHKYYPINKLPNVEDMRVGPGLDAFVIGFPLGIKGGGAFPIWKKGTIASEPDILINDLPKMYLDTATREGMSGSPVVLRTSGPYLKDDGNLSLHAGTASKFIGVYASRIGAEDEFKAQLGVIWKSSVIDEIIDGNKMGEIQIS